MKGKKEVLVEEASSSTSELSSSDEEASRHDGKPHPKKGDGKVCESLISGSRFAPGLNPD